MARWSVVPVLLLVFGAGCAGFVGDSETAHRQVTPVELGSETANQVDVPQTEGQVDIERVIDHHDAMLANRSFSRRVEREGTVGVREVWVDRDADIVRVQQSTSRGTDGAVVADGTRYSPAANGTVETTFVEDGDIPFVLSLTGDFTLRQFLARYEYNKIGTVRRGGQPLALLEANETLVYLPDPDPDETVHVRSQVYVDREGVIRFVIHREAFSSGGRRVFRMAVETGLDRVPMPPWLDAATVYGEQGNPTPSHSARGGSPVDASDSPHSAVELCPQDGR